MQECYRRAIIDGVRAKDFPPVPVDYGYRDSKNFWIATKKKPYAETVQAKAVDVESVMYAANRIDPEIKFTKEACMQMVKVPRIFLNTALKGLREVGERTRRHYDRGTAHERNQRQTLLGKKAMI